MAQNRVKPIALQSFASSSLTTSYQALNPTGLDGACFRISIINTGSTTITLSYDGVNDHEIVTSSSRLDIEFQNNAQPNAWTALLSKGLVIYLKGTAGTGTIYLSGYYVSYSSTSQM